MSMFNTVKFEPARDIAEHWYAYSDCKHWWKAACQFSDLGGKIKWWCGMPQSASAIPLTFELMLPDGSIFQAPDKGGSRLKDIRAAIIKAKEQAQ